MSDEAQSDGSRVLDLNLEHPPADRVQAENYPELFTLWSELHEVREGGRMPADRFAEWDARVKALLHPHERARFEKPLRPHIPIDEGTIQHARHLHLTKILWARKGIEKFMKDTGY